MSEKVKVAIVGASGYSGEELLRLLNRHPGVELKIITSRQNAGKPVGEFFPRYAETPLTFSMPDVNHIAAECDVAFLALPHGLAPEIALPLLKKGVKIIDISADFRLKSPEQFLKYYKSEHPAPDMLSQSVYGLPERYRSQLKTADLIACAGCYPTSIILAASPLLERGIVSSEHIVASSLSGVSGAGRKVDLPYLFPECNESVRAYGVTKHRHLPEIEQELSAAAHGAPVQMNFIPHLVPVNRGINSTLILRTLSKNAMEDAANAYAEAYENEPFVRVLKPGQLADTKHITLTNRCEIGYVYDEHTGNMIVTSCIDNLTKGASGQAIQCMNIRFGLTETMGLYD